MKRVLTLSDEELAGWALGLLRWVSSRVLRKVELPDLGVAQSQLIDYLSTLQIESLLFLSTNVLPERQALYDSAWKIQQRNVLPIISDLETAGIEVLILKSAELVPRGFGNSAIGLKIDVDILVRMENAQRAKCIILQNGYTQSGFDVSSGKLVERDIRQISEIELQHYELAPFCRVEAFDIPCEQQPFIINRNDNPLYAVKDQGYIVTEVDVHHGIATDVASDQFFDRAVRSRHDVGLTMCPADHLWFVLAREYNEWGLHGKRSLRGLSYLLPLVRDEEVDWDQFMRSAYKHSLGPSLYYPLAFISSLLPDRVPSEVLSALHPARWPRLRDWGWQLPKVLGLVEQFPLTNLLECRSEFDVLPNV